MSIRLRLLYSASAIILIAILLGFLSLSSTLSIQHKYQRLSQQSLPLIEHLKDLQLNALRVVSSTSEAGLLKVLGTNEGKHKEEESELADEGIEGLQQAFNLYIKLINQYFPDKASQAYFIEQEAKTLIDISNRFFEELESTGNDEELLEIKEEMEYSETRFLGLVREAVAQENKENEAISSTVIEAMNDHILLLLLGAVVLISSALLLAWLNARYIVRPLLMLQHATQHISSGRYEFASPQLSDDEFGKLFKAFNNMSYELEQQKKELSESHKHTENILQAMEDMLISVNGDGIMLKVNRATCEQLGYSERFLLGKSIERLLEPSIDGSNLSLTERYNPDHSGHIESNLINKDGTSLPVLISINRIASSVGKPDGFLLVATNITERKVAEEEIHRLAFYDSLTNLPNRTLFKDRLSQALKFETRQKQHLAVLFLDIDDFKQVNDSLGHSVGDQLLHEISRLITETLRDSDVVTHGGNDLILPTLSRHGGDEFLILLPFIEQPEDAGIVAARILHKMLSPINLGGHELYTALSIGIAIFPEDGHSEQTLIQNADTALYSAKAAGKNQFAFFKQSMNRSVMRRMDIENNLRNALEKDQFRLFYQPQISLQTGKVVGMETLIRWIHPEWGIVSPVEFIPVAESSGMIIAIGEWVIHEACQQWSRWQAEGYNPAKLSINLSAIQFKSEKLGSCIRTMIEQTGIAADSLVFEITESALMLDAESTLAQLHMLKGLGVRLSVDDFGTGYSSLKYLKSFPLDYLKIDRAFVQDLENSNSDREIVSTIIHMAKNLKLELVAEGVETPGQLRLLQQEGCDSMQGFLLSKPIDAQQYERDFLSEGRLNNKELQLCQIAIKAHKHPSSF